MSKMLEFNDIQTGQEIPSLVKCPSKRQLVMWAGASGDYNPIHYDKDFAISQHLAGVVVHGQLVTAFLAQMVTDWAGETGSLNRLSVSYKSMNYPDETLTCRGIVTGKSVDGERHLVTLSIWTENPAAEKTVVGTAVLQFV